MTLYQLFLTKNECYLSGRTMTPKGIMVHSTGAPNPKLSRYVGPDDGRLGKNPHSNHWNQSRPDGRQICCHAFIGKLAGGSVATYQTLPWTMRGWHGAKGPKGSGNDFLIGFEICEDNTRDPVYFRQVFDEAVDLCAYLCKKYGLTEKDIIDHAEGYRQGIASNHGDVGHWFPKHGESMDSFRSSVKKAIAGKEPVQAAPDTIELTHKVKKGDTLWSLAGRYLGNPQRWKEIQKNNGGIDPRKLRNGMTLKIPTGGNPK
jgi:LysM repeat protein